MLTFIFFLVEDTSPIFWTAFTMTKATANVLLMINHLLFAIMTDVQNRYWINLIFKNEKDKMIFMWDWRFMHTQFNFFFRLLCVRTENVLIITSFAMEYRIVRMDQMKMWRVRDQNVSPKQFNLPISLCGSFIFISLMHYFSIFSPLWT